MTATASAAAQLDALADIVAAREAVALDMTGSAMHAHELIVDEHAGVADWTRTNSESDRRAPGASPCDG